MKALRIIGLVLLAAQGPFLFAAALVTYADLQSEKLALGDLPAALVLNYWYILRAELMLVAAAALPVLLGWLLWKLAKWAGKPRTYTGSGSGSSSSYSTSSPSRYTHRRAPSHHHAAASAGASAYAAQSTTSASAAPDYFADAPAPSSSAPDYFAGRDDSYDTSSGGGGFDSKDDNSGTW